MRNHWWSMLMVLGVGCGSTESPVRQADPVPPAVVAEQMTPVKTVKPLTSQPPPQQSLPATPVNEQPKSPNQSVAVPTPAKPPATKGGPDYSKWVSVGRKELGFSVRMPKPPESTFKLNPNFDTYEFGLDLSETTGYFAGVSVHNQRLRAGVVDAMLLHAPENFADEVGGTVIDAKVGNLSGGRDIEFKVKCPDRIWWKRIIHADTRMYMMIVAGSPEFIDGPDARHFMSSFRLVNSPR